MRKIMITGATGSLGGRVLKLLIESNDPHVKLYALTRDLKKLESLADSNVTLVQGDYDDQESLVQAFQGIDILYFVSGSDIANRSIQHSHVVSAAQTAGVGHVVYTSFQRRNETATSPIALVAEAHIKAEGLLKVSGMKYTIMKHALYSDIVPMFIGSDVLEKGIIYQPAGDGRVSFTSRNDMAAAALTVLTGEGHENKVYEISNVESYSYHDIAHILTKISGKAVTYVSPSADEFVQTLTQAGVPAEIIGLIATFSEGIKQGEFDFPDTVLEQLIGRKPESMEQFLTKVFVQ